MKECKKMYYRAVLPHIIRWWAVLLLLFSFVGVVGCSGSSQCKENSECGSNQVCTNGACTNAGGCTSNQDCTSGKICEGGACKENTAGCKDKSECKDGEDCKDGKCVKAGCTADSCPTGETCENGTCVKKESSCTADSCKTGELCVAGKQCVKVPLACQKNGDCEGTELCAEAKPGSNACFIKCDPAQNASDGTNKSCWGGFGLCQLLFAANPNLGVCVPPREKNRKKGETCNDLSDFTKPDFNECEADLNCTNGKCLPNCKESEGTATNPVCSAGTYCEETDGKGLCKPLPEKQDGGRTDGQTCSKTRAEFYCDGDKGFYCNGARCAVACDPRKGKDNNPKCGTDQICQEDASESHLGGGCIVKPTQKEGEDCSQTKLCLDGLTCSSGKCVKSCDPTGNDCPSGNACHRTLRVCVKQCDPAKGGPANPDCVVGTTCQQSPTVQPGYCRSLPSFDEGKQQLGDSCSAIQNQNCDGSKQLYCSQGTCRQACDLRKGASNNPKCQSTEECTESTTSPWGGVCLAKASAKEGDPCNSTNQRCETGLSCYRSRCARDCKATASGTQGDCKTGEWCLRSSQTGGVCLAKCDPVNGTATNTDCPKGTYCNESTQYKPGYCTPLPSAPEGKAQKGESCSLQAPCDGSKDLDCFQGQCIQVCDPKDGEKTNAKCATGESCLVDTTSSFLGGICLGPPTQKENEECDGVKRCVLGLLCADLGNKSFCQKSCDPQQTGQCPTGTSCQSSPPSGGYCLTPRKKTRKLNEECRGAPSTDAYNDCEDKLTCAGSSGTTYCLATCTTSGGSSTCPKDYTCVRSGTSRVCAQVCTKDEDCKAYGGTCTSFGQTKYCL
ncbi:MAG: hypothetical protein EP343_15830 [Deltaproteobacteria bacterium]|nr:MAG: hypothetical protein EP343_15830 [Deltaproteobacteria bacterium]